jgi:SNF2 family DNA or RNA helicase
MIWSACNHPLLVTKDYKKDLAAVESQASKKGSETDANDLLAAFSQMGITGKCQMCTMEFVHFKFKILGGVLTPFDSIGPHNAGEGKWSGHCEACIPLAKQAQLAESEHPSSAKIRMILKLLKDIDKRSESTEKTIIFSQFTSMLDLVEPFLKEKGIRFVRCELLPDRLYDVHTDRALDDGSMSPADREAALAKIKNNAAIRVILISFKSGNTGKHLGGENVL